MKGEALRAALIPSDREPFVFGRRTQWSRRQCKPKGHRFTSRERVGNGAWVSICSRCGARRG